MQNERELKAMYNNAKRAARVCLSDEETFSPVYVQIAVDRMMRVITEAAAPQHLDSTTEAATSNLVVIDTNPCRE